MRGECQKQRQDSQFTADGKQNWRRAGHSNSSRCRLLRPV